ncbi:MAG TPA: 2-hydroxyacid dehydrogenase [Casimicrobiaceae bacterium]|nr:2-hydroxyacid dehydrogenase [Casimicrobiaceae bacterium]
MSAPPAILIGARIADDFRGRLASRLDAIGPWDVAFPEAVKRLPRADAARVRAALVYGGMDVSAAAIAGLPALRLILSIGSGYDGIDLDAARAHGASVTHSPGANASSVADMAVGLMVASVRRIAERDAYVRRGAWNGLEARRDVQVRGLTGRRAGIYGLGAIGAKIASRCEAFEMEVGYHGRAPHPGVRFPFHATLAKLAAWADVLMVAVRAGPETHHAVDARVLAALGRDGHVVNITRGSVIDEVALIAALASGTIAGAGLDVFEREPLVPAALRALPNVVMTPHIGGNTDEAQRAMHDAVIANLDAFLAGQPLPSPVPGMPAEVTA